MNTVATLIAVTPPQLPPVLDLGAVALGAVYGATLATARKAPLIGVLIISVTMGVGGSIIRDLFLNTDLNVLVHERYMATVMVCTLIGVFLGKWLLQPLWLILMLDALVMGAYVVMSTEKSFLFGMPTASSIFIGTVAAIGGGILSDVLLGNQPDIMSRGPWSASIAFVCAIWFTLFATLGFINFAEISTVVLAVGIKGMALWRGWEAPMPEHLYPTEWIRRTRR
jgi:uncharacterized membrane protein YeiH